MKTLTYGELSWFTFIDNSTSQQIASVQRKLQFNHNISAIDEQNITQCFLADKMNKSRAICTIHFFKNEPIMQACYQLAVP